MESAAGIKENIKWEETKTSERKSKGAKTKD
jgi:hypothetical protein